MIFNISLFVLELFLYQAKFHQQINFLLYFMLFKTQMSLQLPCIGCTFCFEKYFNRYTQRSIIGTNGVKRLILTYEKKYQLFVDQMVQITPHFLLVVYRQQSENYNKMAHEKKCECWEIEEIRFFFFVSIYCFKKPRYGSY